MVNFNLTNKERKKLYELTISRLEKYYEQTATYSVTPNLAINEIRKVIKKHGFEQSKDFSEVLNTVIDGLEKYTIHTGHPRYLGLFNPRSNFSGILADLITAVFNPQLAAWSHAPFAVEVENYLVQAFGKKFGYDAQNIDGVFATGGAEANLTAVLCALNHQYPNFAREGVFCMTKRPVIYCSSEAHHSVAKAAKIVGLGYQVIQHIPVDERLSMKTGALVQQIETDLADGKVPLMVVATAGTTGAGGIDDLREVGAITKKHNIWFHVDGAYGGAAILNHYLKHHLAGIETSDSIIFDAHKWLSLPMGISMFLTNHREILGKTFRVTAEYMPKEADEMGITDPFTHSIQWSRRFIGLKLYLSLLFHGWDGYQEVIEHQRQLGEYLKSQLIHSNWVIKNNTPFPILCFTDDCFLTDKAFVPFICQSVIESGQGWLSQYPINGQPALRTSITNYATSKEDVEAIVVLINEARNKFIKTHKL